MNFFSFSRSCCDLLRQPSHLFIIKLIHSSNILSLLRKNLSPLFVLDDSIASNPTKKCSIFMTKPIFVQSNRTQNISGISTTTVREENQYAWQKKKTDSKNVTQFCHCSHITSLNFSFIYSHIFKINPTDINASHLLTHLNANVSKIIDFSLLHN